LILVFGVIGAGVVSLALGKFVKAAVEAAGPRVLGAPVTLGLATISPWTGRGTLRGLVIGNPQGFKTPNAVKVGAVEVTLRLSSLLTDMIVVDRVVVRDPEVVWEMGSEGSNLTRLQRNAEASAAKLGGSSPAPAAKPAKPGRSLLIRELEITGGKVGLAATAFGDGTLSAPLPPVRLTNLGGEGRSPSEAAAEAMRAVTSAAQRGASNIGSKTLDAAASAARSALGSLFRKGGL
jgi:uncharacterized protein involved in outer membrane biogenesis